MIASLLHKYGPHLKGDFVTGLMSSYGLMGLTILVQLVLVPLYLGHLGKEHFGVLAILLSVISYAAIGITWLSGGMARILGEYAAHHDTEGFEKTYAFSKILYVCYALLAVAAFWGIAPVVLPNITTDETLRNTALLTSLYFVLLYEYNTDRLALNAKKRQALSNGIDAAGQVVFAALAIWGLKAGWGLESIMAAQIAGLLASRCLMALTWRYFGEKVHWGSPGKLAKIIWKRVTGPMGRGYVIYGILALTLQADVMIVGALAGPETAADFYLVWRIPEIIILVLWRIPGVLTPHLIQMDARGETEKIRKAYDRGLKTIGSLAAAAGLFYAFLGPWIVDWWVGPGHAPDDHLAYILAGAAAFFLATARWPAGIAYALVRVTPLVRTAAIEIVGKLFLTIALLPVYGYIAPVIAIVAMHVLGVFFLYLRMGQQIHAAPPPGKHAE